MILDFELSEVMKLSNIKRWGIVEMSREQSVAEHSYNVAILSVAINNQIPENERDTKIDVLLEWALYHDLPEIMTGDIPTTIKKFIDLDKFDAKVLPKYNMLKKSIWGTMEYAIVKAADYIEALQFADKFCIDSNKEKIIADIEKNAKKFLEKKQNVHVAAAMKKVLNE